MRKSMTGPVPEHYRVSLCLKASRADAEGSRVRAASAHATVVLGLDMWMRRLRSMGVATTTASAGTASMVLARSSTCAGDKLQHISKTPMARADWPGSTETMQVCAGASGAQGHAHASAQFSLAGIRQPAWQTRG